MIVFYGKMIAKWSVYGCYILHNVSLLFIFHTKWKYFYVGICKLS